MNSLIESVQHQGLLFQRSLEHKVELHDETSARPGNLRPPHLDNFHRNRVRRSRASSPPDRKKRSLAERAGFAPPVTLLKPLHGAEPDLDAHLATFFEQDYPEFEILFCARTPEDKGLQTAQRVAAKYPKVSAKFVTTGEPKYINAKVSSLEKMMSVAQLLSARNQRQRCARNAPLSSQHYCAVRRRRKSACSPAFIAGLRRTTASGRGSRRPACPSR